MKALLLLALVAAVAGAPMNEPVPISETASQSVLDAALANNLVRASTHSSWQVNHASSSCKLAA